MLPNNRLIIESGFEPGSLIGKQFTHDGSVFELVSILGAGAEGIVYEVRSVPGDASPHTAKAFKVYRRRISDHDFQEKQNIRRQLRSYGLPVVEEEFFYIHDWPVTLMPKMAGAIHFGAARAASKQLADAEQFDGVIDRINAGDFADAVRGCDDLLEDRPLHPDCLRLKAIALLGMGKLAAANESLRLCFEVDPGNTEHHVAAIEAASVLANLNCVRLYAGEGLARGADKRAICKAWFAAEHSAERAGPARRCLEELRSLGEPETSLGEMRTQLRRIEERMASCEQEIQGAWHLLRQGKLDAAEQIAHRLKRQHPHHAPAWLLSGVVAFAQELWAEAISHLYRAFRLHPMDPDVPFLLVHAHLELGKIHHAIAMYTVWRQCLEHRLVPDSATTVEQCRSIQWAFRAISDADPDARECVVRVADETERLLGSLAVQTTGDEVS